MCDCPRRSCFKAEKKCSTGFDSGVEGAAHNGFRTGSSFLFENAHCFFFFFHLPKLIIYCLNDVMYLIYITLF